MKSLRACAMIACLLGTAGAAVAQYEQGSTGQVGGPTLLALPEIYKPNAYGPATAGQRPGVYGVEQTSVGARQATTSEIYDAWTALPTSYAPTGYPGQPTGPVGNAAPGGAMTSEDWMAAQQGSNDPSLPGGGCDACGPCAPCEPPCCRPRWYGGVFGLYMGRDRGNKFWTSAQSNNNFNQVLNTQDADTGFRGGGEITFGRWFGCDCGWGVQATYWTLDPFRGYASLNQAQTGFFFNTPIDLQGVNIGGVPATNYFDGAQEHVIERRDEVHNVELNIWKPLFSSPNQRFQMGCLAGVRYFRFNEDLLFASAAGGASFTSNGGADAAYLDTNVISNLVGFQIGTRSNFWITPQWGIYWQPMVGVFGNHMQLQMELYRGDGGFGFDHNSTANDVSFLGQFDLGVQRRIGRNCSLYAGYRVLAISGIALADNQIPPFLVDTPVILDIDSNADLVLHGGVFGLMWNY